MDLEGLRLETSTENSKPYSQAVTKELGNRHAMEKTYLIAIIEGILRIWVIFQ